MESIVTVTEVPPGRYIGTKIIEVLGMEHRPARPNWPDELGVKVRYSDGYESWSPLKAFLEAYRPVVTTLEGNDGLDELETMIQAGKADAPRVTPEKLRGLISEVLFIQPTGTLMICVLTLKNGFTVTGESACASPENFRENIGRLVSYQNALNKLWPLEGYLLKERLYQGTANPPAGQ